MNIFSQEDLDVLRNLPEVVNATTSNFTVTLPERIQQVLLEKWGLRVTTVPFRRMTGDTAPHVDVGSRSFEKTYLAYLTDGEGTLEIGEDSYPITAGSGFVFPNGTRHGVVDTNGSSRLMLGPMSEMGLSVGLGTILNQDGATDTVYIRQVLIDENLDSQYKINDGDWNNMSFPLFISNTNGTPASNILKVLITTDLTFTDALEYIRVESDGIQIGDTTLRNDGTRPVITIDGATDYPGFINNGGANSYVYIYNLKVELVSGNLLGSRGWIAGNNYGGTNNFIINCSSDGLIPSGGGGIVGADAGTAGSLTIIGCSSYGIIETDAGGIAGLYAGSEGGTVTILKCWSTGNILGDRSGGIVGGYAGDGGGSVSCEKCYSRGTMFSNTGGIFGAYAGDTGSASASYCYSMGDIGVDGGGIFGSHAGYTSGSVTAAYCYSKGSIPSTSGGIIGLSYGTTLVINCYASGETIAPVGYIQAGSDVVGDYNYSEAANGESGFNSVNALPVLGSVNYVDDDGENFLLRNFGASPYSLTTIQDNDLVTTYSETVAAGVPSTAAVVPGYTYTVLEGTPTINGGTGALIENTGGTYTVFVLASTVSDYSVTTVTLTVTGDVPPPPPPASAVVPEQRGKGYDFSIYNDVQVGRRLVQERLQNQNIRFKSFEDYHKYKMALLRNNLR